MQPQPGASQARAPERGQGQTFDALSMTGMVARPSALAAEFVPSAPHARAHAAPRQSDGVPDVSQPEHRVATQTRQLPRSQPQPHSQYQLQQMQQHQAAQFEPSKHGRVQHRPYQHQPGRGGRGGRFAGGGRFGGGASHGSGVGNSGGHSSGGGGGSQNHDIYANYQIRENARHDVSMLLRSANSPGIPETINHYYNILPLEAAPSQLPSSGAVTGPSLSIAYKAVSANNGSGAVLRRVIGPAPAHSGQIVRASDIWKRISHPGIVALREVFTTRTFTAAPASGVPPTNEVVFAYELCPRADTLQNVFLAPDQQYHALGEATMWALTTQLLAATAAAHDAGLAFRSCLSPSSILVTGRNRVRVNRIGMMDAFDQEGVDHLPSGASGGPGGGGVMPNGARIVALQKADLASLGRILLVLATRSQAVQVRTGVLVSGAGAALDALQRSGIYTADFVQVVGVLLAASSATSRTVVRDVLSMIGPRLAAEMSNVWTHADSLETQLVKECDASRLFRLQSLLGFVNERYDASVGDAQWSETGDNYLLKLFRDYVFHQVDEAGRPSLDLAHVVECLNRLDIGSPERLLLSSRDGSSLIAASYEDLRRCLMQAVEELRHRPGRSGPTL